MNITINNLTKTFNNKRVLNIPTLELSGNNIISFIGNNGAGKTTFFRLLVDLLQPSSGYIFLSSQTDKNINPAISEEWKSFTSAYLDESYLINYLSPEEYFAFIAQLNNITEDKLQELLASFAPFMNNEIIHKNKLIREFSAGNKQKIGIIAAFLSQPQLIILDEPFNFLDPSSQLILKRWINHYVVKHHALVLISSHNLQHCIDLSNRIILLEHGTIIDDITNKSNSTKEMLEKYFTKVSLE